MRNRPLGSGSQSVARALSVLDLLEKSSEGLGVREIARRVSLSPSIVQRLIGTLLEFGYVERSTDGQRYRIGYRAFQVGRSYLAQNDLHTASLPELRELAERHHVNAYLGVLRDRSVVYLEALQSRGPIAITSAPGSQGWLHSTAFGKALLAELSDAEVAALLGPEPFHPLTRKTKTKLRPLLKELQEVRRLGYAMSDEENLVDVFAAGAAVRDASGRAIAAISGAVPRNQMGRSEIDKLCRLVAGAAERISRRLGAAPRGRVAAKALAQG
jgi:DNA-binding IclR family transcriptional regulator